ncbi:protein arginine kinase activator [Salsuginibacillus halophilus]|uniref:Protein arginine kinase activator n=1 Tax=Salsuginibacillus halophilus TaxID=517424 RepID=A0A2P8H509_9BACI|nr:UvrB/UvrC motif-containing protein [Salsuginibacillus halophilus]PSL41293.1 protein arginine kinase activator [Salsuginibacillus halophilus]
MLCQQCQKRQATLHFTKIVNNEKTEMSLCDQCAKERGDHVPGANSYSIHELLSGLLHSDSPTSQTAAPARKSRHPACQSCGMTYEQFRKVGKLGCARCYETFEARLKPVLSRVHSGYHMHTGKSPKHAVPRRNVQQEIEQLQAEMQEHIVNEEFEKAAEVRDRIRALHSRDSLDETGDA